MLTLTYFAIAVYFSCAILCALAAWRSRKAGRKPSERMTWLSCASLFMALSVIRYFSLEDRFRQFLRGMIREGNNYDDRWTFQAPLAAAVTIFAVAGLVLAFRFWPTRRTSAPARLVRFAGFAALGYLPLFALRLISMHMVDRLLYAGPVRLNWVIDGGLALIVAACAAAYAFQANMPQPREHQHTR